MQGEIGLLLLDGFDLFLLVVDFVLALFDEESHLLHTLNIGAIVSLVALQLVLDDAFHRLLRFRAEGRFTEREEVLALFIILRRMNLHRGSPLSATLIRQILLQFMLVSLELILTFLAEVPKMEILEDFFVFHVHEDLD